MNISPILDSVIRTAERNATKNPGDFTDPKTGLLMCGNCKTPKQTKLHISDLDRLVPCMCRCDQERAEREQREQEERERQRRITLRRAACFGRGNRKAGFTFAADDGKDAIMARMARNYVEHFPEMKQRGKGLLFLGPTGTGKTFFACAVANALIDRGYTARVTTFANIASELQSSYDKSEVYTELNNCDLLVLDDLGTERGTSYMEEIIFTVIDDRCTIKKPLIVTTNLMPEDLNKTTDMTRRRIFSRLKELCIFIPVAGADRRQEEMANSVAADMALLLGET